VNALAPRLTAPAPTGPRLRGRWLGLARLAWLAVALTATGMMLMTVVSNFSAWARASDADCNQAGDAAAVAACLADNHAQLAFFGSYQNVGLYYGLGQVVEMLPGIVMGFFIFWRRSDEPYAQLFALMLVLSSIFIADGIVQAVFQNNFPALWPLANFLYNLAGWLLVLLYRFPDGRFQPPVLRWAAVGWVLLLLGAYLFPNTLLNYYNWPTIASQLVRPALALSIVFALVYRYQRVSGPSERQQIKWFVVRGAGVALVYTAGLFVWPLRQLGQTNLILNLTFLPLYYLAWAFFPIGLGVAILRYRLWEIDLIIRRTLIYSTLTGVLVLVYFGSVVVLEALAGLVLGDSRTSLVIVLSTLTIAALFGPLRARVQRGIDRRFYRSRYDAGRILAAFGSNLRHETDLPRLTGRVVEIVEAAMAPTHVTLWISTDQPLHSQSQAEPEQR
jgi:hypothetical protein